mgnify:CR=1 FL=1
MREFSYVHDFFYVREFLYTAEMCMKKWLVHELFLRHPKVHQKVLHEFFCVKFFGAECVRQTSFHAPNVIIHVIFHALVFVLLFEVLMRLIFAVVLECRNEGV